MELQDKMRVQCELGDYRITDAVVIVDGDGILLAQDEVCGRDDPLYPPYLHSYYIGCRDEWVRLQKSYCIKPYTTKPVYEGKLRIMPYGDDGTLDKVVRLKLHNMNNGDTAVIAVNEEGKKIDSGNIVVFRRDGSLCLCGRVSRTLGLQLDEGGSIKADNKMR